AVGVGQIVRVDCVKRVSLVERGIPGGDVLRVSRQDRHLQRRRQGAPLVCVVIDARVGREWGGADVRQVVLVQGNVLEWGARGWRIVLCLQRWRATSQQGEQNADAQQSLHASNQPSAAADFLLFDHTIVFA